jgi:branched-chain amino acid transport system substrate-binding protein
MGSQARRRLVIRIVSLVIAALPVLTAACSGGVGEGDMLEIGAVLPLTGALASYGESSEAALAEAVEAINAEGETTLSLAIEDSGSDPQTALAKLQDLHERGINIVVGPYSSSEVLAGLDFANQNELLLLSPLSTAHSLATPDDSLFRFTPDDVEEGIAVANVAWEDGVRALVIAVRDDEGNRGLGIATRAAFEELGGIVVDGLVYPADEEDFEDEITSLEETVAAISTQTGEVGIYLAAFAEVENLFVAAADSELAELRWYGSNSVALSRELIENDTAAAFAIETGYPNPILGLREADQAAWGPVSERIAEDIGRSPDAFALAAYDALAAAHQAAVNAGGGEDVLAVKAELVAVTDETTGLTGPLSLNEAGDRALATFDFWAVCERDNGDHTWSRVATYSAGGTAERLPASC